MLTPAPHIPSNLGRKIETAVRAFQREYDDYSVGDLRRQLKGHGYKMPVLCALVFHRNATLSKVSIVPNLKDRDPSPTQIACRLTIFGSPEYGAKELLSEFLRRIGDDAGKQFFATYRHQAVRLTDDELSESLRRIPKDDPHRMIRYRDVSLLTLRRVIEMELEVRAGESKHARLARSAQSVSSGLAAELEAEHQDAQAWAEQLIREGSQPYYPSEYDEWAEVDRMVLAYREERCRTACRLSWMTW